MLGVWVPGYGLRLSGTIGYTGCLFRFDNWVISMVRLAKYSLGHN